jgi:putative protease
MNLASHLDELIKSGVIDSLKIEGRTKSAYYAAITASTYRDAIDDYFEDKFDAQKYQKELHTTKHRGFSDAYLISRPFEKHDTQKHDNAISSGSHEVAGLVREDGEYFMCKYKIFLNEDIELILPKESKIDYIDNEFGTIFAKNGKNYIRFYRLLAESGKELEEIHSGNLNPIKLPIKLPSFSIFRKPIEED